MQREAIRYLFFGALAGVLLAYPAMASIFLDDALIHARLADHIHALGLPIFNQGAVFKAGSSTGYVYLIALLSPPVGAQTAIRIIEFVTIALTVTGLAYLVGVSPGCRLGKLLAVLAVLPFFLLAAYGGMETPIVCLLMTMAAIACRYGRHGTVVFLIALGVWFRFEMLALLSLVLFHYLYSRRLKKTILLFSFPVFLLFWLETSLFGSIIPNAVKIKSVAYGFPLFDSVLNALGSFALWDTRYAIGLLLLLAAGLHVRAVLSKQRVHLDFSDVLYLFSVIVFVAWLFGRTLIFSWYYCLLAFPFGLGFVLQAESSRRTPLFRLDSVVLSGFFLCGLVSVTQHFSLAGSVSPSIRVPQYVDIGSALYAECPSCTLVTSEIGGLGYGFKGKVWDAFGLGDPEAAPFHPMNVPDERQNYLTGAIPPRYVTFRDPDFIVTMPCFTHALRKSEVIERYQRYDCPFSGNATIWDDSEILIFSKQPLPGRVLEALNCRKPAPATRP